MKFFKLFRKNKSFTLIELVMTIVVVGIVALPISITLSKHVQSVFDSQNYTLALDLARFKMEEFINTAYASIAVGTTVSNYSGYVSYDVTSVVTLVTETSPGTETYKTISISVAKTGSGTPLITLKTYIANAIWGL
jgi:type II secretory pathway pseudopilin PulG